MKTNKTDKSENIENTETVDKEKKKPYLVSKEVSSAFPMPFIQVGKGVYPDFNEAAEKMFPQLKEACSTPASKRMKFLDEELKKNKNEIYRGHLRYFCTIINGKGEDAGKKLYIFQEKSELAEILEENQRLLSKIEGEFLNYTDKEREVEKEVFNLNQAKAIRIQRNTSVLEEKNLVISCEGIDGMTLVHEFVEETASCLQEIGVTLKSGKSRPVELNGNLHFICRSLLGLLAVLLEEKKQDLVISVEKEGKNGKILLKSTEVMDLSKLKNQRGVQTFKKIWFAMGGEFLNSTTSEGTDFIFYLPLKIKETKVATGSYQGDNQNKSLVMDDTGGFGNLYVEFSSILPEKCYSDYALDL